MKKKPGYLYFWLETDFAVYLKYYLYWNTNNNMALSNGQNSSIQTGITQLCLNTALNVLILHFLALNCLLTWFLQYVVCSRKMAQGIFEIFRDILNISFRLYYLDKKWPRAKSVMSICMSTLSKRKGWGETVHLTCLWVDSHQMHVHMSSYDNVQHSTLWN